MRPKKLCSKGQDVSDRKMLSFSRKERYSMKKIYIATDKALAIARQRDGQWVVDLQLTDLATHCLAVDPQHPEEVYCGTFGQGLWRSSDAGRTWENVGTD